MFYFRIKSIKKKEEQKTFFNKQLSEMEMKALRAQMNPHFIFNAINSIQNYIVKKESDTAQDYLAKFARLIRNVLENSKQENISLHDEIETLKLYVELEQLRAPDKFEFRLEISSDVHPYRVSIPPLLLQPYIENAILHGLMPLKEKKGLLMLSIQKKNNKLACIIEDNGIGRKKAEELKQKKQTMHKSMGLSVTKERLEIINSLHIGEASVEVEDKFDINNEPEGTRVTVFISF